MGDWSSGMIPALGAGGREFDSRITPSFCLFDTHTSREKNKHTRLFLVSTESREFDSHVAFCLRVNQQKKGSTGT